MDLRLLKFIVLIQLCSEVRLVEESLLLVHVIARHCERTPAQSELHPKSPYYDESNFAPFGYGQLTNEGKQNCYNVGRDLRQRYEGFLDASYHYSLIEGRSTYYDRAKNSLQLILAGLFPPTEELVWKEGMNWIPVATYYDKAEEDKVLCPMANPLYIKELMAYKQILGKEPGAAQYADIIAYASEQIGEPIDFEHLAYHTRGFQLMGLVGLPLPNWTESIYPNPLTKLMVDYFYSTIETKTLRRFYGGYFLRKIVEDSERKINGTLDTSNRKMFIYGVHDYNIQILLIILDSWDSITPPLGSSLVFEVHNRNGTYGFKILYFRNTSNEPEIISLRGSDEFLPLNEFKIQYRDFLELDDLDGKSLTSRVSGSLILMISLLSLCCLL